MSEQGRNETFPRVERIGDGVFIHVIMQPPDENTGLIEPTEIAGINPDYYEIGWGTELRFKNGLITRTRHPYEVFLPVFRKALRMAATKSDQEAQP